MFVYDLYPFCSELSRDVYEEDDGKIKHTKPYRCHVEMWVNMVS